MKLENGSRNLRGNRAFYHFLEDVCFVCAAYDYNDFTGKHDISDTHSICLFRHIVFGIEETLICVDGACGQIYTVSHRREAVGRFVETDVAVVSQTQKLQIDAAYVSDNLVVCVSGFVCVLLCSIWHECTLFRKIYVVE